MGAVGADDTFTPECLQKDSTSFLKKVLFAGEVFPVKQLKIWMESYNRMTLDGMRWSADKIRAIRVSMTEEEQFFDYVFPGLRYHDRITELTKSDFTYYFKPRKVTHNGYYMRVDALPFEEPLSEEKPEDLAFGSLPMAY